MASVQLRPVLPQRGRRQGLEGSTLYLGQACRNMETDGGYPQLVQPGYGSIWPTTHREECGST
jgi:hypothetical protein